MKRNGDFLRTAADGGAKSTMLGMFVIFGLGQDEFHIRLCRLIQIAGRIER
jgi:hypothetical protein